MQEIRKVIIYISIVKNRFKIRFEKKTVSSLYEIQVRPAAESGGLGLRKVVAATGTARVTVPELTRFRIRARRPKAGPFYGRACSRDRQLPGRQAALLFARPVAEERRRRGPPPLPPVLATVPDRLLHRARKIAWARVSRGETCHLSTSASFTDTHTTPRPRSQSTILTHVTVPRINTLHAHALVLLAASFLFLLFFFLLCSYLLRKQGSRRTSGRLCEDAKLRIDFR